jgi:GH25 family lysozyme M1 (1,4-beta-N-acetylmuramidase)
MRKPASRLLLGVVAAALAVLTAVACTPLGTTGPMAGAYTRSIWGPDVSNWQHPYGQAINWRAVKAQGASFAFVKVSEGSTYVNPYAANDLRQARAAGLYVSGYHFGRPRLPLSTAAADARRFAAQLGNVREPGFLPPVLDLEVTGGLSPANVTAWAKSFMATLQSQIGRVPMIYSGNWFWRGYMGNPSGFAQYPLWAAQYTSGIGPNLFGDFSYSSFWQYTDSARVNGIPGGVDASWFHGSMAQLKSLAWVQYLPANSNQRTANSMSNLMLGDTSPAAGPSTGAHTGSRMAQDASVLGR